MRARHLLRETKHNNHFGFPEQGEFDQGSSSVDFPANKSAILKILKKIVEPQQPSNVSENATI